MLLTPAISELFPTPLWSVDLDAAHAATLNAHLKREILALLEPRPVLGPGVNWQTDPVLHRLPQFAELVGLVDQTAAAIARFLRLTDERLEITGCWANVNPQFGQNSAHNHPNNLLAGVYYVDVPDGEGRIVFHDPRAQAQVLMPPVAAHGKFTANSVTVAVKPGRFVFFPGWLMHSVPVNAGTGERITIAFNLMQPAYVERASPPLWRGTAPVREGR